MVNGHVPVNMCQTVQFLNTGKT